MTRQMIVPVLFGIIGALIFCGLGVWQLQRLAWKQSLLAEIEHQILLPAVELPENPTFENDQYTHVKVAGSISGSELHVLTSNGQPGYRVISAVILTDGRKILVDRGFIPQSLKDVPRNASNIVGTGNLTWPDETDGYTPDPDLEGNVWFARDVDRMANYLETAPIFVVLNQVENADGIGVLPLAVNISNRHMEYVLTWFGFAIIWIGMTGLYLWRIKR